MTAKNKSPKGPIRIAMLVMLLGLGGCAGFTGDGGYGFVESTARERIGKEVKWIKSDADADSVLASVKGGAKSYPTAPYMGYLHNAIGANLVVSCRGAKLPPVRCTTRWRLTPPPSGKRDTCRKH